MKRTYSPSKNNKENIEMLIKEIEFLNKKLQLLQDLQYLADYFNEVKGERGQYIVEMRRLIYNDLQEYRNLLTVREIASIIGITHASAIHLSKMKENFDTREVKLYYREWINDKIYPASIRVATTNEYAKSGQSSKAEYILVKTRREIQKYKHYLTNSY
jgi:hypothetical protein